MIGTDVQLKLVVTFLFVLLFYFRKGVANRNTGGVELPSALRTNPAHEMLSLDPHQFRMGGEGPTAAGKSTGECCHHVTISDTWFIP
jgi:hypothetical protein